MKSIKVLSLLLVSTALFAADPPAWVSFGSDHRLHYRADDHGNRIMDFSHAGYQGGGVALPVVPVVKTVKPVFGDNTAQIQSAIDAVSHGTRGAVLLSPGTYDLEGTLTISASGVVLRGSGSGERGTTIRLTGSPHRFLEIRGSGVWQTSGKSAAITNDYVPSGADAFDVDDSAGFQVGDTVLIKRPVTEAWVHFMGMDTLVRDGKPQTWLKVGSFIHTDRTIRAIAGKRITLDVPLTDSFDAKLLNPPGAAMLKYSFSGRISGAGVESLRLIAPAQDVPITAPQYTALHMNAVMDAWVKDIVIEETQNGIVIGPSAKRITLDGVRIVHTMPHSGAAAPADFAVSGTQILLNRCSVDGEGTWPVVTQAMTTGPIVVLNFTGSAHAGVSPHQRWATGLLVDNARLPNTVARTPAIAFSNRKTAGSGHGWDVGWAVAWNVTSPYLLVQQPPGAMNWCIGCIGEAVMRADMPSGIFENPGAPAAPASLYLEQLRERLGPKALENIGYPGAAQGVK